MPGSIAELLSKWEARQAEWRRLGVHVMGAAIADEILSDLHQLETAHTLEPLTLTEAALASGYSIDRLQKMVAGGQLENVGKKGSPRIRRGDLPRKPGHTLPAIAGESQFGERRRIAASAIGNGAS